MIPKYYSFSRIFIPFLFLIFHLNAQSQLAGSGRAYDFNSNFVSVPNNASLNVATITIEAWIKADSWAPNIWENSIVSKDGWATGDQGYCLRAGANGALSFNFGNGSWHEVTSPALMQTGKWYHVAATYNGSIQRIFINGIQVGTSNYTGSISSTTYDLNIGRMSYTSGGTRFFDGSIDEVRIWNTALSEAVIKEYMCQKVSATHPNYSNLRAYYNFDLPGTVVDQSPLGNNGTVSGATHVASGAAIGDKSTFVYGAPANLTLPFGSIDTFQVTTAGNVEGLHVYRVDGAPFLNTLTTGINAVDQTHYYGVFLTANSSTSYTATYRYANNPITTDVEPYLTLVTRLDGAAQPWIPTNPTVNTTMNTLSRTIPIRQEYMLGVKCPSMALNYSGSPSFCAGDLVNLTLINAANTGIQWYSASGPISGATTNTVSISAPGSYYVTANTGICASTSASVNVSFTAVPSVDFGLATLTHCETAIPYTLSSGQPSGGTYSGSGVQNGIFSPNSAGAGTHTIYYVVTENGCTGIDSVNFQVNPAPPSPTITQGIATLCAEGGNSYAWFLNNTPLSATDSCLTVTQNGNYSVVSLSNAGCASDTVQFLLVDLASEAISGLEEIIVYPNPSTDFIQFQLPINALGMSYSVTNEQGGVQQKGFVLDQQLFLSVRSFPAGVYFVQFTDSTTSIVRKFVKK